MQKRIISVCTIVILVCSIYGCTQTTGDTPVAETENMEAEPTGDATEQEEKITDSSMSQEEPEFIWNPEKESYIDTEQVISDFLSMDAIEFQEKYDRDELYQSGILYCGQEAWKTHLDYIEEFHLQSYYTLENITAIRFYKEQPVTIYLDMNIGDRVAQYETNY